MASAHVHRNAEKLASIRATPRLVNILHAVGAELALRRASWPRSPPRSLSSSPSSNPADNEATKPTDERGNEQTGKARAWKECETRMGRKKKKKIGSRTSLPVMSDANNRARSAGCCARFSPGALLVASGSQTSSSMARTSSEDFIAPVEIYERGKFKDWTPRSLQNIQATGRVPEIYRVLYIYVYIYVYI